jgi:carbonic anhydrase/acetyltransferase-like protein (isoleucine patch superfamily)
MPILPFNGVWPRIAEDAFVAPNATIVGDVVVESGASIWFGAVIRADMSQVRIGAGSNIQDNATLHTDEDTPCIVGADCSIGHNAVVHGATLGDRVLIGMHATVLNGAALGDDSIVAASALVSEGKRYAPGQLLMGIPARVLRPVSVAERERILTGSLHYQRFARDYRQALAAASKEAGD